MSPFKDVESNDNKMRSLLKKTKKGHLVVAIVILAIVLLAFVIAVIVLAVKATKHPTLDDVCKTHGCLSAALEFLESMNTNVDPCDDFYQFACGKWVASYPGPAQHKMGKIALQSAIDLSENIFLANMNPNMPESVREIAKAYIKCGKYGDLREIDIPWLLDTLLDVGGWPMMDKDWEENEYHWERNLAQAIHNLTIRTPITVGVDVNYLDTEKYIIQITQHSLEETKPLDKKKILSIAKRIGDRDNDYSLEREYQEMEKFAELLQKMSRTGSDLLDDPNERKLLTIKELRKVIPWVNWLEFLHTIFGPYLHKPLLERDSVLLIGSTYISKFLELAFNGGVSKRTLANYLAASFIQNLISVNNNIGVQNANLSTTDSFEIMLKDILLPQGYSPTCLTFVATKASFAVDFINYKYRKMEYMDDKMIDSYYDAMKDLIKMASWLDEKTRQAALEKLKEMKLFSGFPEKAKDGNKVEEYFRGLPNITDNVLENQLELQRHLFKKQVELLSKPVDRNSWPTTEGTHGSQFNAYYVPELNRVVILADTQKEPIFSPERPKYWNFGSFGWFIGHEVNHGFDTSGSKRDKYGNIRDWWMPQAKEEFERRSRCFIEQYDKIKFGYKDYHVNGTKTLSENVADNGGLRQSFRAYKLWEKINGKEKLLPGLENYDTHQLFFISAAQPWCSFDMTPEMLYNFSIIDSHTPTMFRTNPVLSNSEDFANVFKCKSGSPMNPVKKCVIW